MVRHSVFFTVTKLLRLICAAISAKLLYGGGTILARSSVAYLISWRSNWKQQSPITSLTTIIILVINATQRKIAERPQIVVLAGGTWTPKSLPPGSLTSTFCSTPAPIHTRVICRSSTSTSPQPLPPRRGVDAYSTSVPQRSDNGLIGPEPTPTPTEKYRETAICDAARERKTTNIQISKTRSRPTTTTPI